VIVDPAGREAFKQADHAPAGPRLALAGQAVPTARESARAFTPGPVPAEALGRLLAALATQGAKRPYASAGALYPVQTYVHARHVDGLAEGLYYHDPVAHALVAVAPGLALPPELHFAINLPLAEAAAFSAFFVAPAAAIRPLYGAWSERFCHLEAGAMAQLLADAAPALDLALCPVGHLDFERVRAHLPLDGEVILAHALLGGLPDAWEVLTL
jgi:SagB-type dehydrogenase family enzyme